jgi:hypothetical protein
VDQQYRFELEQHVRAIERNFECAAPGRRAAEGIAAKLGDATPPAPAAPEPFSRWLLAQRDRGDWIDELAGAARKDPGFPKNGTPDDVRKRMGVLGIAEADVFEQIDDAERRWMSL